MKGAFLIAFALLVSVAFVATVFAQAKPADRPATAPEKAPVTAPEKKAAPKAQTFKGEFVSQNEIAKTIAAKDTKGEMTFDISGIKKLAELKAGEKIMVLYIEKDGKKVAKTIVKQAANKEAPKKEEVKQAPTTKGEPAKPVNPGNK